MDSLISRQETIEYLMTNMGWTDEDGYAVDDADEKRAHIEDLINGIPSVPAVPLDKLCEWLAGIYGSPCQLGEIECYPQCEPDREGTCLGMRSNDETCWKSYLAKWMEGLDD